MSTLRAIILTSLPVSCARREGEPCQECADGHLPVTVTDGEKMAPGIRRADRPTRLRKWVNKAQRQVEPEDHRRATRKGNTQMCSAFVPACERVFVRVCLCISGSKIKEKRPRSLNKDAAGTSTQSCREDAFMYLRLQICSLELLSSTADLFWILPNCSIRI